jgi:hypothetical protein
VGLLDRFRPVIGISAKGDQLVFRRDMARRLERAPVASRIDDDRGGARA